jgi:RHS repeat-associated protein
VYESCTYFPYGGIVTCTGSDPNRYKFTGKERDTESNLDMFGARYYGSSLGRFMTPDWSEEPEPAPYADLRDPQSLNLYSYVRNNPMSSTDDDGHECTQDANGNIHCVVNEKAPDDPKINRAYMLGAIALENEELGPYAWGGAALLFTYGCIQTHCLNIFSQSKDKDTPSPPPADTSSTSKTASPNPDPDQKGKPDDKKKADDQIRGRLKNSKSYSSEYGNKTYGEIKELAKQGDAKAKAMKKLIEQSARLMEKVGNK